MKNYDERRAIAEQGGINPPSGLWKSDYKVVDKPTDGANIVELFLPTLERRRVYLHLESQLLGFGSQTPATNDFLIHGEIDFLRGGSSRAKLPVQIGRDANLDFIDHPAVNFFPNPEDSGGNAIHLTLSKLFIAGTSNADKIVLTPYELDIAADQCIFRVLHSKERNRTEKPKIRVWLGVLSMTPT